MTPTLIVITGPTASGKSDLAVEVASRLGTEIISADSRQIYRGIPIGTAQPTAQQLAAVPHHFVASLPLTEPYSAARFETEAQEALGRIWQRSPWAVMCGGSMMYIDAVTRGLDDLPTISPAVRSQVLDVYNYGGLEAVRRMLAELDPVSAARVDPHNPRRNIHSLEICLQSGRPASELLTGQRRERPWHTLRFHLDRPRDVLFDRINRRVDAMIQQGLLDEVREHLPLRHLNALNTVGYKELFAHLDGQMTLPVAIERIKKNTRVYAKKQLTWLARPGADPSTPLPPSTAAATILHRISTLSID